eukprot:Rmarinus@m.11831
MAKKRQKVKKEEKPDDDWEVLAEALKEKESAQAPAPANEENGAAKPSESTEAAAVETTAAAAVADAEPTGEDGNDNAAEDGGDGEVDMSKLSKKERDKLKKKLKQKEKKADKKEEKKQEEEKKEKKPTARARLIQQQMEAQRKAEEEARKAEEELRRKEEEEAARLAEEERKKEEAKQRKKDKEKQKKEQLKKEGKWLTKSQREAQARNRIFAQQLMEMGMVPAARDDESESARKKVVYDSRKKKSKQDKSESAERAAEEEPEAPAPEKEAASPEAEAPEDADEGLKDSWEDLSEDDLAIDGVKGKEEKPKEPKESGTTESPVAESKKAKGKKKGKEADDDEADPSSGAQKPEKKDKKKKEEANLRSPICCILGHVDTGKTKLLDKIRRTNVQEGEAGGITQQIGATYFPMTSVREKVKELDKDEKLEYRLPGLLVIDTPGHESFANLRSRGSSLCDIAILVIDIMHGLEPQTIESINLLKMRKTPFIVALNKIDRLYGWKATANAPFRSSLKKQADHVKREYEDRMSKIMVQIAEQGLNSLPYYKNKEVRTYVSLVPTSAHTGEGIPDLLMLIIQLSQRLMEDRLMYLSSLQCTVLEVKSVEGLGMTIDVILVNGVLHEGDEIVLCGLDGPIVTNIRALLTPHPMKEMRVKGSYLHHKEILASQGVKIAAQGLENAVAGSSLLVRKAEDNLEAMKAEVMSDLTHIQNSVDRSGQGVYVQASTLGSLEALLEFLKQMQVPVCGIGIGPIHKKDVMKASVMVEKQKEFAVILAFDVKVTQDAHDLAGEYGVRIFTADIIYHLFDQFEAYLAKVKAEKRAQSKEAVFPCILRIYPEHVYNKKDPIIIGVEVVDGILKNGTPLCVKRSGSEPVEIGKVTSIESNHKPVETAKKGESVAIKIHGTFGDSTKLYGRHFDHNDPVYSLITRTSIDELKKNFREDLAKEDWILVVKLKKLFHIL